MVGENEDSPQESRRAESGGRSGGEGNSPELRSDRDSQDSRGQGEWYPPAPSAPAAPPSPGPHFSRADAGKPRPAPAPPGPSFREGSGTRSVTGPAEDLRESWFGRLARALGLRRTNKV